MVVGPLNEAKIAVAPGLVVAVRASRFIANAPDTAAVVAPIPADAFASRTDRFNTLVSVAQSTLIRMPLGRLNPLRDQCLHHLRGHVSANATPTPAAGLLAAAPLTTLLSAVALLSASLKACTVTGAAATAARPNWSPAPKRCRQ